MDFFLLPHGLYEKAVDHNAMRIQAPQFHQPQEAQTQLPFPGCNFQKTTLFFAVTFVLVIKLLFAGENQKAVRIPSANCISSFRS